MAVERVVGWILIGVLGVPVWALAQGPPLPPPAPDRQLPPLSGFAVVPWDFGPPGARSLGMGGTFIGLADDATAAQANPAGLINLSRPEVSIHGRYSAPKTETLDLNAVTSLDALNRFRVEGDPVRPASQQGNAFATDTRATFEPESTDVSFASYVHPGDRMTWSIFYQRSVDFSGRNTFRAYDDSLMDLYQTEQNLDLTLDNYGVSFAFKASPKLAFGLSVRYSGLKVDAFQDSRLEYLTDLEADLLPAGSSLQDVEALNILDQRILRDELRDDEYDITYNAGILYNPGGRVSVGLVYKYGGEFDIAGMVQDFSCLVPAEARVEGRIRCDPEMGQANRTMFKVPDFLGFGLAIRATERLRLAFDVNAITYSDLQVGPAPNPDAGPDLARQFEPVEDGIEYHVGLEYVFFAGARRSPLTVRMGAYTDPDHDGTPTIDSDETAFTFGLGLVLMEKLQIDVAGRSGDLGEAGILSVVYRF